MIKINEIFTSISGEAGLYHQGTPMIFVRFSGCNLQCSYCDTRYADEGIEQEISDILTIVKEIRKYHNVDKVLITGGEPLVQEAPLLILTKELFYSAFKISIETNGSIAIPVALRSHTHCFILDYKLGSSGMKGEWAKENFWMVRSCDFIKFVIATNKDYKEALDVREKFLAKGYTGKFAFSPVFKTSESFKKKLANDVVKDGLTNSIISLQIHKYLGVK